jgi:hypothetical protein
MQVLSRGEVVGEFSDVMPDMWYLEGKFTPFDSPAGARFFAAASALSLSETMYDHERAIRSIIRESPDAAGIAFLVMSLSNGSLFGRRVFGQSAVEWIAAHVPE